jgi:hypothetical protein
LNWETLRLVIGTIALIALVILRIDIRRFVGFVSLAMGGVAGCVALIAWSSESGELLAIGVGLAIFGTVLLLAGPSRRVPKDGAVGG